MIIWPLPAMAAGHVEAFGEDTWCGQTDKVGFWMWVAPKGNIWRGIKFIGQTKNNRKEMDKLYLLPYIF